MLILLLLLGAALAPAADSWISLFDGRSLSGWHVAAKPEDRDKGFWQVRDGLLTCDSRGRKNHNYVWLVNEREFGDFELQVAVRGFRDSTGNSGVQFRSRFDEAAGWMNGPQADIHPPAAWRTGLIYDETRETRRWISPSLKDSKIDASFAPKGWNWKFSDEGDGWNILRVVCRGAKVQTWLNGVVAVDFDGAGILDDEFHRNHGVGMRGNFALQLHTGDDLYIQYREIKVRTLK